MGTFIVYIIKCAFCLAFFYLFNKLLLSRETFHKFNRYVWLAIIPVSIFIPLFPSLLWDMLWTVQATPLHTTFNLADSSIYTSIVSADPQNNDLYTAVCIFPFFYFAGVLFFASRWLYSYSRLLIFSVSGRKNSSAGGVVNLEGHKKAVGIVSEVKVVLQKRETVPFSWMKGYYYRELMQKIISYY
ncbi:MAG: hypothetical protein RR555_11070 [Bacteroidales bacterium]